VSSFSIGVWLAEVASGGDSLTVQGMTNWLVANTGATPKEAKEHAGWVLESFGEYDVDRAGPSPLALVENRGIAGNDLNIDAAARTALNYLRHAALTKQNGPGQAYPSVDIPDFRQA
jgi:hypothetical protein